ASRRDRRVTGVLPLAWSNDYAGTTLALRSRSNYLGRFEKNVLVYSYGLDRDATHREGIYVRWGNPVSHPIARTEAWVSGWSVEGRAGVARHADRSLRQHPTFGADQHAGVDALWVAVSDTGDVDGRRGENAGTREAGPRGSLVRWERDRGPH